MSELSDRVASLERSVRVLQQERYPAPSRRVDEELASAIDRTGREWIRCPLDFYETMGAAGTPVQTDEVHVIAAGGTAVVFPTPFDAAPEVTLGIGWDAGLGMPTFPRATAINAVGFTVTVYDAAGVEVNPVDTTFTYSAKEA